MRTNKYSIFAAALVIGALVSPTTIAIGQVIDCGFTFTVTYGCSEDGTGWAKISGIEGKVTPSTIHWDFSEAAGGPMITGLTNGVHNVALLNNIGCEVSQTFTIDCPPIDDGGCQFRTQTQGGWGTTAHGNNPGTYRDAHFANAFPNGIEIGCTNKLRLTTSAAVRAFLPSGSTARALNAGTITDPGNSYRNVLAGQLVALTLSVGFDANDPAFGSSNSSLGNAILLNGPFAGWTVNRLLDEANRFIGGCGSSFSAAQFNRALSMVNENFVDGSTDNGNIGCTKSRIPTPGPIQPKTASPYVSLFPNPVSDILNVYVRVNFGGPVRVKLMDMYMRQVRPTVQFELEQGAEHKFTIEASSLTPGTYMVAVEQAGSRTMHRVVISH